MRTVICWWQLRFVKTIYNSFNNGILLTADTIWKKRILTRCQNMLHMIVLPTWLPFYYKFSRFLSQVNFFLNSYITKHLFLDNNVWKSTFLIILSIWKVYFQIEDDLLIPNKRLMKLQQHYPWCNGQIMHNVQCDQYSQDQMRLFCISVIRNLIVTQFLLRSRRKISKIVKLRDSDHLSKLIFQKKIQK